MTPFVHNVNVDNVNQALPVGLRLLANEHLSYTEDSRNGPVRVMRGPVVTVYRRPLERVLFSPMRDANPFFHLFESLWMLAGRNDLKIPARFNKRFTSYSDDGGTTQPAAYGHRWRNYFGYDQIEMVIRELTQSPGSRRAVLAMWDGGGDRDNSVMVGQGGDLGRAVVGSADIPCNTHCYFTLRGRVLDMAVMCRSNDILWGAYGANAVHFSVLLEYIAARLGAVVGTMYQFSYNYHVYLDVIGGPDRMRQMASDCEASDHYSSLAGVRPTPIVESPAHLAADVSYMMDIVDPEVDDVALHEREGGAGFANPFFKDVAVPMWWAWQAHKRGDYVQAEAKVGLIQADDWRRACREWIERRAIAARGRQGNAEIKA